LRPCGKCSPKPGNLDGLRSSRSLTPTCCAKWLILLIPFVNLIIWIILCIDIAKNFGKGAGFIGLLLLPFIFFLILGFGSAQYQGASAPPPLPATA